MDDQVRELVALGKEHFQRGDFSLAAGHLEQVVARGHDYPDVHHMLGCVYHQLGAFEAAEKAFARALELNPSYVEAALNLAIVLNDLGKYAKAQEVYGKALAEVKSAAGRPDREPLDAYTKGKLANLHAAAADGYSSVRRPREAAEEYRKALELCPTFVDVRLKLAGCLRDAGDMEAALAEYKSASRMAPAYLPARVAFGTALYAAGRIAEAILQWDAVLEVDPDHRTAAMYLKLARSGAAAAGTLHEHEVGGR